MLAYWYATILARWMNNHHGSLRLSQQHKQTLTKQNLLVETPSDSLISVRICEASDGALDAGCWFDNPDRLRVGAAGTAGRLLLLLFELLMLVAALGVLKPGDGAGGMTMR